MTTDDPEGGRSQPLIEHLIELRSRLVRIFISVLVVFLCLFYFSNDIYSLVSQPLKSLLPETSSMIATDVASPFFAPFKLTVVVSVLLAMPAILYQVWAFIAPGLYRREKRVAMPLLTASVLLFYGGITFAYYVVFPILFGFFTAAGPEDIKVMTDINSYLDFVLKLFFAFGFAFQIPVAVVILAWTGVVDPATLSAKRPYVVVGCFVVGMLLTPPDIFSQVLLAGPMWLLFELGVIFGRVVARPPSPENDQTS